VLADFCRGDLSAKASATAKALAKADPHRRKGVGVETVFINCMIPVEADYSLLR